MDIICELSHEEVSELVEKRARQQIYSDKNYDIAEIGINGTEDNGWRIVFTESTPEPETK